MKSVALLAALTLLTRGLAAQEPDSTLIYVKRIEQNPEDSRAIFRLASLRPAGSEEAIDLYRRYVQLEPDDAWGHLALAEAYAVARRFDDAASCLSRAQDLAPGDDDVATVKRRIERARRNAAPVLQPRISFTRDSDANLLSQWTAGGEVAAGQSARLGVLVSQSQTSDGLAAFRALDARATLLVKTRAVRFDLAGGGAQVQSVAQYSAPVARARLRWNSTPSGFAIDLRAAHAPMLISPILISNRAVLSEARATVEAPLFGIVRARGAGQIGRIATNSTISGAPVSGSERGRGPGQNGQPVQAGQSVTVNTINTRTGMGGGLVFRFSPLNEWSATYYELSYEQPTTDGYFAPRRVQILELGTYAEVYRLDPLTISVDLGGGIQQSAEYGAGPGAWVPAVRGWTQFTIPLGRVIELNLESEAYRSQANAVTTSGSWSSISASVFFRFLIL